MAIISVNTVPTSTDEFDPWPSPIAPGPSYLQRVWDTGTAGWCYYTKSIIDPSPLSGETSPNWTGSISSHSVVEVS